MQLRPGQFHIYTIDSVLDGAAFLTNLSFVNSLNHAGNEGARQMDESVERLMSSVQTTLERFQQDLKNNQIHQS